MQVNCKSNFKFARLSSSFVEPLQTCETVRLRKGVTPIHSETPEKMSELLPSENIVYLKDGQELILS